MRSPTFHRFTQRVNLLSTSLEMIPLRIQKRHFLPFIWFICSSYWKRRVLCPAKFCLTKWGQYQHLISWNATISSSYCSSTKYCKALMRNEKHFALFTLLFWFSNQQELNELFTSQTFLSSCSRLNVKCRQKWLLVLDVPISYVLGLLRRILI